MLDLKELLPLLRSHGVRSYKSDSNGVAVEFYEIAPSAEPTPDLPSNMPPELKNPDLMSQSAVLNWSAPGGDDYDKEPLPLTGEEP